MSPWVGFHPPGLPPQAHISKLTCVIPSLFFPPANSGVCHSKDAFGCQIATETPCCKQNSQAQKIALTIYFPLFLPRPFHLPRVDRPIYYPPPSSTLGPRSLSLAPNGRGRHSVGKSAHRARADFHFGKSPPLPVSPSHPIGAHSYGIGSHIARAVVS